MVTKEQAIEFNHFHFGVCYRVIGPRGGETVITEEWRRAGATKTWKRSPERFDVPLKHGLYDYGRLTEHNAPEFHPAKLCKPEVVRRNT